ncbi:hypothetical protein EYZ11_012567 [Aspergillus tanneri]|uniref:Uncharacterized protein n=1 Tax=Aspergillus tanneri TaxID=1220188 RepID=A0A4S3IZX7_9EURO|nr:hypothetical protein EYZ11_012567 [Aspergillus tanneri]
MTLEVESTDRPSLRLPNPPPLLHTRSGNEPLDRPSTPAENGFTSPVQTPQGSPSKSRFPPGAIDLPNVFDKAMKLNPTSPTKNTYNHYNHPMFAPPQGAGEDFNESVIRQPQASPTRKGNKENRPLSPSRLAKNLGPNPAAAAISRHEHYQTRDMESIQRRSPSQAVGQCHSAL